MSFVDFLLCALNEFRCFFVELCALSELCCLLVFCIFGKCCFHFIICCFLLYIVFLLCALDEFHRLLVVHSWWVSLFPCYASLPCYKFRCLLFYCALMVSSITSLLWILSPPCCALLMSLILFLLCVTSLSYVFYLCL